MNDELRAIERFQDTKTLVIGEAILDRYLYGDGTRMCREAPVQVVSLSRRVPVPGGAANCAVNVADLGAPVTFLSAIGSDGDGEELVAALEQRGVASEHVITSPGRATLVKNRLVAGGQLLVRFDEGTTAAVDREAEEALIARLADLFHHHDVVIVSDYRYGILTERVVEHLTELQATSPRIVVVDGKDLSLYAGRGVTAFTPSYEEVRRYLSSPALDAGPRRLDRMEAVGEDLVAKLGAELVAVTLDIDGALLFERDKPAYRTYADPAPNFGSTGAGDTFAAAFALALGAGCPSPAAAEIASVAASLVVHRDGTSTCSLGELRTLYGIDDHAVIGARDLQPTLATYRTRGERIVFTNGCFDILHRGHVTYLSRAKGLGDKLIVGVNSDASVRRLKGPDRPLNSVEDRVQVLKALSCVDHVVVFDGDTATEAIEVVQPDVYVKGGDYAREMIPEIDVVERYGGRVEILPYVEDRSTTAIVDRIRKRGDTRPSSSELSRL